MERARASPPCPCPHPWQSGSSEQTNQMNCGRQTSAWPLGMLLCVPVWLAARSIPYDSRVTELQRGLFQWEGWSVELSMLG